MRAFLVAVDYTDMLEVTLPYNRHHFEEVIVITTPRDTEVLELCDSLDVTTYKTEAFYHRDSAFNKFRAVEGCLDVLGREGWICLMDADILWPKKLPDDFKHWKGNLCTPRRHMMKDLSNFSIPDEKDWPKYPLHRQEVEFAGYTQIFHGEDKHLPAAPWHQINWRHAGGADSFFQDLWPKEKKVRPNWNVLHLGEAGENWCGRASQMINGSYPIDATDKKNQVRRFIQNRTHGPDRFSGERY